LICEKSPDSSILSQSFPRNFLTALYPILVASLYLAEVSQPC
jgi:hypothetical protein